MLYSSLNLVQSFSCMTRALVSCLLAACSFLHKGPCCLCLHLSIVLELDAAPPDNCCSLSGLLLLLRTHSPGGAPHLMAGLPTGDPRVPFPPPASPPGGTFLVQTLSQSTSICTCSALPNAEIPANPAGKTADTGDSSKLYTVTFKVIPMRHSLLM